MSKHYSPSELVWLRLKQNKPAMAGLFFIVLLTFSALFCYLFIPDDSANSNTMSLPVSMQKPGFTTEILYINHRTDSTPFFERMTGGRKTSSAFIPLQQWRFEEDEIVFTEFTGDEGAAIP